MNPSSASPEFLREIKRRRTFAIISHPDAGKTTLTEKLLLYGGAIHLAGAVKAKKSQKHTTSDWMEIEKQRGISISTTVLQFEYQGSQVNLLDTPGHKDFSEDTYRTLMAVDAAVMLIDAAKGVEPQTRKLFEVCAMRKIPIFTFVNKVDRPALEPLDLLDELEKVLGIRSCPMTWPIGTGDRFRGVYDLQRKEVLFFQTEGEANVKGRLQPKKVSGTEDPMFRDLMDPDVHQQFQSELELLSMAGDTLDLERVNHGQLTPVFFGSALNNFGVERFLEHFLSMAPPPVGRESNQGLVEPSQPEMTAFVFKILANMDPKHRDRVSFVRICSGTLKRNMDVQHTRLQKTIRLAMPLRFFGQERVVVEDAYPGDIVGILDTSGQLRIGDTLSEKKGLQYPALPIFSPEQFASLVLLDPMKRKQLQKGVEQLSEEGVVQIFRQKGLGDKDPILGAVGQLQFEVFKHRLFQEYGVDVRVELLPYTLARWVQGPEAVLQKFADDFDRRSDSRCLLDRDGHFVTLFTTEWAMRWAQDNHKEIRFLQTSQG